MLVMGFIVGLKKKSVNFQVQFVNFFFPCYILQFSGEEIVAGDDIYGGSDRLLSKVVPKTGVLIKFV